MGEERITGPGWRTEQEWRKGADTWDWQEEQEEGGMTVQVHKDSLEQLPKVNKGIFNFGTFLGSVITKSTQKCSLIIKHELKITLI